MTSRLAALLDQATPPLRIAGIPPGVISASDWDVTDEVLSLFPDMARLLVDMADTLDKYLRGYEDDYVVRASHTLLARFAALDEKAGGA